jgi:hypothetical protein
MVDGHAKGQKLEMLRDYIIQALWFADASSQRSSIILRIVPVDTIGNDEENHLILDAVIFRVMEKSKMFCSPRVCCFQQSVLVTSVKDGVSGHAGGGGIHHSGTLMMIQVLPRGDLPVISID